VRQLAIGEIAVGHGHRYFTVVLDLESGRVLFVRNGNGNEALLPFWRRQKRARAWVKAVAIDISPAYELAVATHLPDVQRRVGPEGSVTPLWSNGIKIAAGLAVAMIKHCCRCGATSELKNRASVER